MKTLLAASLVLALMLPLAAQDIEVAVKEIQPFSYCAVAHRGPYTDMTAVVGQLVGAMQAQGLFTQVRGPMIGIYFNSPADTDPADLDWEAGFIVAASATVQPPLVKKVWERLTVAAALHRGPYAEGGRTVAKMMAWLAAHGYRPDGPVLERYMDQNPLAVKPADLRTEIWIPVAKR